MSSKPLARIRFPFVTGWDTRGDIRDIARPWLKGSPLLIADGGKKYIYVCENKNGSTQEGRRLVRGEVDNEKLTECYLVKTSKRFSGGGVVCQSKLPLMSPTNVIKAQRCSREHRFYHLYEH